MKTSKTSSPRPTPAQSGENRQLSDRIVLDIIKCRARDPSRVTPDAVLVDLEFELESVLKVISRINDILVKQGNMLLSLLKTSEKTTVRELQDEVWKAIDNLAISPDLVQHPRESQQTYVDLKGDHIPLAELNAAERKLVAEMQARARSGLSWNEFENYWISVVEEFYGQLPTTELQKTVGYRVGQDLGGRLAIAAGRARLPDYRDELAELIRTQYRTRREFCEVTGLKEAMLSQVLSGRKHLSIETLNHVLDRINYRLRLVPRPDEEVEEPAGDAKGGSGNEMPRRAPKIDLTGWNITSQ